MPSQWTIEDSLEYYQLPYWGRPFFSVNSQGNITVQPIAKEGKAIDLKSIVDDLQKRGIEAPLLVRFDDILHSRVRRLHQVFMNSIREYNYSNTYRTVMPIKVNQQRHVIEEMLQYGKDYNLGLEAGSKPELLIGIAQLEGHPDSLLICNGYKDEEYIETALDAQRLGIRTILVLDRFAELKTVIEVSKRLQIQPEIGIRAKLSTRGSGRWEKSTGDRSKFGLTTREIVKASEELQKAGMLNCLKLLHFHIGSQVTSIRSLKAAVRESSYLYTNLRSMGANQLQYIDVGGGLAIDYDGSQTNFQSSKNYSTQEYANDIVSTIQDICDATNTPHPAIISESGRSLTAHHSILVFNIVGTHKIVQAQDNPATSPDEDAPPIVHELWNCLQTINKKNFQEAYNDAVAFKEQSASLFSLGIIDLPTRAQCDDLFWEIISRVAAYAQTNERVSEDLKGLPALLSDTFFCNFSIFQSLPDSWALNHLFPITPIHRLDEEPTRNATLADLTCDSDGKIDEFIDIRNVRETLRLHEPNGSPYYLGAFLVGAYQEILGDLHNLFGDTNAVHLKVEEDGSYSLTHHVEGDSVREVLEYVEFDCDELTRRVRKSTEKSVKAGRMTLEQSAQFMRRFQEGLAGYTYLEGIKPES